MINYLFNQAAYGEIIGLSLIFFLWLYFGLGYTFDQVCRWLHSRGRLVKIDLSPPLPGQRKREILNSLVSIAVFSVSGLPIIYLYRQGYLQLLPDTTLHILWSLVLLNFWNELHFFMLHRLMHAKFFMKNIHYVHHQSVVPSVYSVYSFHVVEAILLSTVQLTLLCLLPLSSWAILLYPLNSILLNFSGHCNYRFGEGKRGWFLFATIHNKHHSQRFAHFGFALPWLDKLYRFISHKL